jgi:hypothetical protein
MKEKYDRINMSKLSTEIKEEFIGIKEATENFDPEFVPIEQSNFDDLYAIVEKSYPEALKKAATVKKTKPAIKKKVEPKPKKKVEPKPTPKGDIISECQEVLKGAGYVVKKIPSKKGGRPMVVKKKRQDRTIIKDRVEETFKPILKDISGSKEKDEKFKEMKGSIEAIQGMIAQLLQLLNNLAEDNSTEKVKKIEKLLKEIVPE